MNKKKNKSFEDRAKAFLIFVVGAYIIGWLGVKSVESSSNREQQVVEGEVEQLQKRIRQFFPSPHSFGCRFGNSLSFDGPDRFGLV